MHDLTPVTALGGTVPRRDEIGNVSIVENPDLALASVAARQDREDDCRQGLETLLGYPAPAPGKATPQSEISAMWLGPEQWMLSAPLATHELLADVVAHRLGESASVTEQNDAWACFDIHGPGLNDLFERLCPAPVRKMTEGDAQRTVIEHIGCLLIILQAGNAARLLGPRSSADSLHHALKTAARSIV